MAGEDCHEGNGGVRPGRPVAIVNGGRLPDFRHAPNQAGHAGLYEVDNQALDPEGHVPAASR
jgi:hypothetical protein